MRSVLIASSALALATGCMVERAYDVSGPSIEARNDPNNIDPPRAYRPVRSAVDGRIQGDVGPARGINQDASQLAAYDDGYYMSVETVVELENRAAMTLLSVSGPDQILVPGYVGRHTLETYDQDSVNVTVLGCVGQQRGVYDEYDMPADEVTIAVADGGNGELDVDMTARWFDRDRNTGDRLETFKEANTNFTLVR
jgi:hypothetical protein